MIDAIVTPEIMAEIRTIRDNAGKVGFNEYGVPLHACNGYRHDEHWWKWVKQMKQDKAT